MTENELNEALLDHEVKDRAYSVMTMFETLVVDHPHVVADAKLRHEATGVFLKLYEFYNNLT